MSWSKNKKAVIIAALGSAIEYYDNSLCRTFMPMLAPLFFPAQSEYDALIRAYSFVAFSMLAKPLGGLFFGYIGDIYGRRIAMLLSISGVVVAALALGLCPSVAQIGISASIIFFIFNTLQIFCFGGEYAGAGIYSVENATPGNRGFANGVINTITISGSLLAALVGLIVTLPGVPSWAWRLGFLGGSLMAFISVLLRKNLPESLEFSPTTPKESLATIFKTYPREMLTGMLLGGAATLPITLTFGFINGVLMTKHLITPHQFMILNVSASLIAIPTLLAAGRLSDKVTTIPFMIKSRLFMAIVSIPLVTMIQGPLIQIALAEIAIIVLNEAALAPTSAYLRTLFPASCRYRGAAFSFCSGLAIFGGSTPIIAHMIYRQTHSFASLSSLIFIISMASITSMIWLRQSSSANKTIAEAI